MYNKVITIHLTITDTFNSFNFEINLLYLEPTQRETEYDKRDSLMGLKNCAKTVYTVLLPVKVSHYDDIMMMS